MPLRSFNFVKNDPAWKLSWSLSVTELVSWGTLYYAFAVIVVPMERELSWSKTDLNGALSLGLLVSGFMSLPIGAWIDRHGGRAIMTFGSLMGGALLVAWAYVNDLTAFYVIWVGLGLALSMTLYEPAFAVIMKSVKTNYRKAITTVTLFGGLANTVFIPLSQLLSDEIGWRQTLLVLASCNILICGIIHASVLPGKSTVTSQASASAATGIEQRNALRRMLRTPVFWGLIISFTAYGTTLSAVNFHFIPMLTERGVETSTIIACFALIGPMQVAGRFALLVFGSRLRASYVGAFGMAAILLAFVDLIFIPASAVSLTAFAVVFGIGNGIMTIVRGTAVPDLLTKEHYGTINGAISVVFAISRALGPYLAAAVWVAAGGYTAVLWMLLAGACLTTVSFITAAQARKPGMKG